MGSAGTADMSMQRDVEKGAVPLYLASDDGEKGSLRVLRTAMVFPGQTAQISVFTTSTPRRGWGKLQTTACIVTVLYILVIIMKPFKGFFAYPAHQVEGCDTFTAFPADTHQTRIQKLANALPKDALYMAEPGPSSEYFTSISTSQWFLSERPFLVTVDSNATVRILVPTFELERAKRLTLPQGLRVQWVDWKEDEEPFRVLQAALEARSGKEVRDVQVDGMLRAFVMDGLKRALPAADVKVAGRQVTEIRERKEKVEIDRLRCANKLTLASIRATRDRLKLGMSESQTHEILIAQMGQRGLEGSEALVLFGPNAALPHGSGTDRSLGKEDLVLIDAGGAFGGYVADITRTFALPKSKVPGSYIKQWESVAKAQKAAITHLSNNPNTTFASLDAIARSTLETPELMTHRLGHGIGLEGHESPFLVSGPLGERVVKSGMVFSVEPGVYDVCGGYGVRIEDCFVAGEGGKGGEWLTGPVEGWGDV